MIVMDDYTPSLSACVVYFAITAEMEEQGDASLLYATTIWLCLLRLRRSNALETELNVLRCRAIIISLYFYRTAQQAFRSLKHLLT
jgi:hypothetical protein